MTKIVHIKTTNDLDDMRARVALQSIRDAKGRGMNEVGQAYEVARAIRKADEVHGLVTVTGFDTVTSPHPALADLCPLVLYFKNATDSAEFVATVQGALPGLTGVKVREMAND